MAKRKYTPRVFDATGENFGYIYVAKAEGIRGYKLGKTKDWIKRVKDIAGQLPVKVEFEYVFKTGDMHFAETSLHSHFSIKRIQLEWFDLDTSDLTMIEQVLAVYEENVMVAVNRRISERPIKPDNRSTHIHKELPPLDTCPICNSTYRRKRANYVTCSYECHKKALKRGGYGVLPSWIWVQAGGVPSWAYNDGVAPNMEFHRATDNLAWEYHRLVDRD